MNRFKRLVFELKKYTNKFHFKFLNLFLNELRRNIN